MTKPTPLYSPRINTATFDLERPSSTLSGIPVYESWLVPRTQIYTFRYRGKAIIMHPLDVPRLMHPDDPIAELEEIVRRLRPARADRKFAALRLRLAIASILPVASATLAAASGQMAGLAIACAELDGQPVDPDTWRPLPLAYYLALIVGRRWPYRVHLLLRLRRIPRWLIHRPIGFGKFRLAAIADWEIGLLR